MDKTKLQNVVSRFEEYLIVDHGLGKTTVEGYGRSLSIALRRMRKFVPSHQDIKRHVYWMHNRHYSYHHIVYKLPPLAGDRAIRCRFPSE